MCSTLSNYFFFFFKQKTAYEMRISDWSSDVCSSDLAIEGVIRQEKLETSQLAVDTHGYTDFAMSHARLLGFDLCPRLKELKQRHLFVPRGTKVPAEIAAVCEANVDVALIEKHWDSLVHLAASEIGREHV